MVKIAMDKVMPEPIPSYVLERMVTSIGTIWQHTNGLQYVLTDIANRKNDHAGFPAMAIYKNIATGEPYAHPAIDWHHSMSIVKE